MAESRALLLESFALKRGFEGRAFLEVLSGSGILSHRMASLGAAVADPIDILNFMPVDISLPAVQQVLLITARAGLFWYWHFSLPNSDWSSDSKHRCRSRAQEVYQHGLVMFVALLCRSITSLGGLWSIECMSSSTAWGLSDPCHAFPSSCLWQMWSRSPSIPVCIRAVRVGLCVWFQTCLVFELYPFLGAHTPNIHSSAQTYPEHLAQRWAEVAVASAPQLFRRANWLDEWQAGLYKSAGHDHDEHVEAQIRA
eukprot:5663460-Amphidinium_carterae.3